MLATLFLAAAGCAGSARVDAPAVGAAPRPECCRELVTRYEASIFKIDVMRVRVRVDEATAGAVQRLVAGGPRSPALEAAVVARYLEAREAAAETEILMGMTGEMFIGNTVKALRGLARDGLVTDADAEALGEAARRRFGFLHEAGARAGDRIVYGLAGDTVTTSYLRGGTALMRDAQVGAVHRRVLLGSYLAPSSEFRRGLLDQVFGR